VGVGGEGSVHLPLLCAVLPQSVRTCSRVADREGTCDCVKVIFV
jgi:hypothetical protein